MNKQSSLARKAMAQEQWASAIEHLERVLENEGTQKNSDRLLLELARMRSSGDFASIAKLDPELLGDADSELSMRKYLISPLLRSGDFHSAAAGLVQLTAAMPTNSEAQRSLVSVLSRLGKHDEAVDHIDRAAAASPQDSTLQIARIQFRLGRQAEEAAALALELHDTVSPSSPDAHVVITALLRGGHLAEAAALADRLSSVRFPSARVAASAVQALLMAGHARRAIAVGEAALAAGQDSGSLRGHIGEAFLLVGRPKEIAGIAAEHLAAGIALTPGDKRLNALYGEVLLRSNRPREAVAVLATAAALEDKSPKTHLCYARALRSTGQYSESADEYLQLLERAPERVALQRQAVGVLAQAGRHDEASRLFEQMVSRRNAELPDTFDEAMAGLSSKLEAAAIPKARFDWAWSLRDTDKYQDRLEWERQARWGNIADLTLVDWLECREAQAEEAMARMSDLSVADEVFGRLGAGGRGFLIATAHVGPLFSGPLLLELCNLPSRWVASTPAVADAHYAASLISTSELSEVQVAKRCLQSLNEGYTVAIAIDGSSRMGSPTTRFEGQDIPYSNFVARASHKARVPSVFYGARWEDDRIGYTFDEMPLPGLDEDFGEFEVRWRKAYLDSLRQHLAGEPRNLRMAGGLWTAIR